MSRAIVFRNKNKEKIYPCPYLPVGSIFFTTDSTNPSTYFGGTWERYGKGRTIVSIDENQTEFKTVGKTGGSKYLQSHNHTMNSSGGHVHKTDQNETIAVGRWQWEANQSTYSANDNQNGYRIRGMGTAGTHTHTINNTGDGNAGNLQPYICVYVWRRTA